MQLKQFTFYYCPLQSAESVIRLLDHLGALHAIRAMANLEVIAIQYYSYPTALISDKKMIETRSKAFIALILNVKLRIKVKVDDTEYTE